jgi:hypothetical protein
VRPDSCRLKAAARDVEQGIPWEVRYGPDELVGAPGRGPGARPPPLADAARRGSDRGRPAEGAPPVHDRAEPRGRGERPPGGPGGGGAARLAGLRPRAAPADRGGDGRARPLAGERGRAPQGLAAGVPGGDLLRPPGQRDRLRPAAGRGAPGPGLPWRLRPGRPRGGAGPPAGDDAARAPGGAGGRPGRVGPAAVWPYRGGGRAVGGEDGRRARPLRQGPLPPGPDRPAAVRSGPQLGAAVLRGVRRPDCRGAPLAASAGAARRAEGRAG